MAEKVAKLGAKLEAKFQQKHKELEAKFQEKHEELEAKFQDKHKELEAQVKQRNDAAADAARAVRPLPPRAVQSATGDHDGAGGSISSNDSSSNSSHGNFKPSSGGGTPAALDAATCGPSMFLTRGTVLRVLHCPAHMSAADMQQEVRDRYGDHPMASKVTVTEVLRAPAADGRGPHPRAMEVRTNMQPNASTRFDLYNTLSDITESIRASGNDDVRRCYPEYVPTQAGWDVRHSLEDVYAAVQAAGRRPVWRNGTELWALPQPNSYRRTRVDPAAVRAAAGSATGGRSCSPPPAAVAATVA